MFMLDYTDISNYYTSQELSEFHGRDYIEAINLLDYDDVDSEALELLKQF